MLPFHFAMLGITFFVMQYYITKGIHSKTHRLFPLMSCTIAVYDFYEIVKYMTHAWSVFRFLEILLVAQMIYVIFFYVVDFSHIKFPVYLVVFFFVILCSVDVALLLTYPDPIYLSIYKNFLYFFIIVITIFFTYYFIRYNFSKREYRVAGLSYIGILIPAITVVLSKIKVFEQDIAMPIALALSLLIFFYLMKRDLLSDTMAFLQESLYSNSNNAYILFDQYFYYLASNELSHQLYPDELASLEKAKHSERFVALAQDLFYSKENSVEIEKNDRYFSCSISAKYYNSTLKGYILSMNDITHQKNELLLEKELKKAAEEKNNQKNRIIIQTSHDLRSPLHNIIGCSDILMRKMGINGEHLTIITQIKNASKNLLSLVNDMLEFSRMELSTQDSEAISGTDLILESSSGLLPMPEYSEYRTQETGNTNPAYTYPDARILIADDMKLNLYIFKELTAPWEFKIDTAMDGQEAIDAVREHQYDLIFLDRLMPRLDGLNACLSIKEMTNTPIVLLSANTSEYDIAEYEPYGFSDYMTKPFTVENLKKVIEGNIPAHLRQKIVDDGQADNNILSSNTVIDDSLFWEDDTEDSNNTLLQPALHNSLDHKTDLHNQVITGDSAEAIKASPTVLSSYIDELTDVKKHLPEWLEENLDLFRTKVHGIKGISRQIGLVNTGEESEIMEMAAKAGHLDYIKRHLNNYLDLIANTLDIAQSKLAETGGEIADEPEDDLFDNF